MRCTPASQEPLVALTSCTPSLVKVGGIPRVPSNSPSPWPGCLLTRPNLVVSDKLTQNEIEELQGTLQDSQSQDTSLLQNLLDKIPDGIVGGGNKQKINDIQNNANAAQMENMNVSPRKPEEFTRYIQQIYKQVMPVIEFHDEIVMKITEAIEKIPILPQLVEQIEDQLSIFVFSIIAPFIVPVINQIKNELRTGSSEIIESSENEQHIVFHDDRSSDPTHSMLSKDHFSNASFYP